MAQNSAHSNQENMLAYSHEPRLESAGLAGELTTLLEALHFQVSHEQTQLFGATFGAKLGTSECEASSDFYGAVLKEKEGLLGVLHVKPFLNIVKATFTRFGGGSERSKEAMSNVFVVDASRNLADPGGYSLAHHGIWAWVPPNVSDECLGFSPNQAEDQALHAWFPHRRYRVCPYPRPLEQSRDTCRSDGSQGQWSLYDHHQERNRH